MIGTGRRLVAGEEYVTAVDIAARWPDVKPGLLRQWVHRGLLARVADPDGCPVRIPGRRGLANVYRWSDVVQAERAARSSGQGRKRGG